MLLALVNQSPASMSWSERRKWKLALFNDSGGNLFGDLLPVGSSKSQLSLGRIGEKTAFDENGWQPAIAKDVIFGRADSAVLRAHAIDNLLLDA